jgi:hypothetical protein
VSRRNAPASRSSACGVAGRSPRISDSAIAASIEGRNSDGNSSGLTDAGRLDVWVSGTLSPQVDLDGVQRYQHLMSRVTRLRAHLRPHAVADVLAASDGRIQFVGGAVLLQMGAAGLTVGVPLG